MCGGHELLLRGRKRRCDVFRDLYCRRTQKALRVGSVRSPRRNLEILARLRMWSLQSFVIHANQGTLRGMHALKYLLLYVNYGLALGSFLETVAHSNHEKMLIMSYMNK